MSKSILRESPLARFNLKTGSASAAGNEQIQVWERTFLGHINLRGDPADARFLAAAESVLGFELPLQANTVSGVQETSAFWLGPNEWLIVTAGEKEAAIAQGLRSALEGMFCAVTEVSGGQTIIVLRGKNVHDLLAKGCPLDLHPRAFGPGRCAQSHLAKAPILLCQIDAEPTFELIVRRSFSDYLWLWLQDAAAEFGLTVVAPPVVIAAAKSVSPVLRVVNMS